MKKLYLLASAAALVAFTPAMGDPYHFTLSGTDTDGTVEFADFILDSSPVPDAFTLGSYFTIYDVVGTYQYGTFTDNLQDLTFYNISLAGGVWSSDLITAVDGPQLYTGTEAAPTFLTGSFTVTDSFSGAPLSLTITPVNAGAVPEPASWAMMISGFGLVGGAARRARRKVTFAV